MVNYDDLYEETDTSYLSYCDQLNIPIAEEDLIETISDYGNVSYLNS